MDSGGVGGLKDKAVPDDSAALLAPGDSDEISSAESRVLPRLSIIEAL